MRFGYYLYHICFSSILEGVESLCCPLLGMLITKIVCEDAQAENFKIINFADCVDKFLGRPWRFPIIGSCELVMQLVLATGAGNSPGVQVWTVEPILVQREAYVDLWCSCQIGDAYIDLSFHLFDTYTSRVNAALPLNPNTTWWPHSKSALHFSRAVSPP